MRFGIGGISINSITSKINVGDIESKIKESTNSFGLESIQNEINGVNPKIDMSGIKSEVMSSLKVDGLEGIDISQIDSMFNSVESQMNTQPTAGDMINQLNPIDTIKNLDLKSITNPGTLKEIASKVDINTIKNDLKTGFNIGDFKKGLDVKSNLGSIKQDIKIPNIETTSIPSIDDIF